LIHKFDRRFSNERFHLYSDVVNAYDCIIRNRDKICEGQINTFEVGTNIKTSVKDLVIILKNLMNNKKQN
jgi:hypothetical protein